MKILIIDNHIDRDHWGARELVELAAQVSYGATLTVRRAPQEDLPTDSSGFDAVLISGSKTSANDVSPWVLRLDEWLRRATSFSTPILGICYGHQSLIRALGGVDCVRSGSTQELGWGEVTLTEAGMKSRLLRGLPRSFFTFHWHHDEAISLPQGAQHLAKSSACAIQAFEFAERPFFGVQFHPERTAEAGEAAIFRKRAAAPKTHLLNPGQSQSLYDPQVGEQIFKNFFALKQNSSV